MKKRVLRLFKKRGFKDYYKVWSNLLDEPLKRDGECNEWNYYKWQGIDIHHNIEDDKIKIFVDSKMIEE